MTWNNYCKHGTYIGTPSGADYICGACEDGADTLVQAVEIVLTHKGQPHRDLGVIYRTTSDDRAEKIFALWRVILTNDVAGEWAIERRTFASWVCADEVLPTDVPLIVPEWGFTDALIESEFYAPVFE